MLPARRTVRKKSLHEEHSSKTFELRLLPVVYLMNLVYMVKKKKKKIQSMDNLEYKNGDSTEDDTFHTTSKTAENVKRVIFIVKVLA